MKQTLEGKIMINLDLLKNKLSTMKIVWDKIRMYGEEEHQFDYWIMASISTDNKIEWYIENTAIDEVIFEGKTYDSCVDFLEKLINKLIDTGKYKYLE